MATRRFGFLFSALIAWCNFNVLTSAFTSTSTAFVFNGPHRKISASISMGEKTQDTLLDLGHHHSLVLFAEANQGSTDFAEISSNKNDNQDNQDENGDFSFFDEASIYVRAGSGGQGSSTYKKAKKGANGIPDGGTGGIGGDVVLCVDLSLNTLAGLGIKTLRPNAFGGGGAAVSSKRSRSSNPMQPSMLNFRAKDGTAGGRMYNNGRKGEDCEVLVPPGTVVQMEVRNSNSDGNEEINDDDDNDEEEGDEDDTVLVDLGTISEENPTLTVARGGRGGEGTATLKGKKKGANRRGPEGGERGKVKLTLKIVADIALVGVPNAGKSTFLASVTRAKPRIADYPFTTVVPNLGTWIPEAEKTNHGDPETAGSNGLVLCDVPGLIEGASEGVGLGHAFLRHIERCRVILHLVDVTSEDPVRDYSMVNDELKHYGSGSLSDKPQVVVLNKLDAAFSGDAEDTQEQKKTELATKMKQEMGHTRLLWVSAKEKNGVDDLMVRMSSYVGKMKEDEKLKKQERNEEDATPV